MMVTPQPLGSDAAAPLKASADNADQSRSMAASNLEPEAHRVACCVCMKAVSIGVHSPGLSNTRWRKKPGNNWHRRRYPSQ
jgi:hypothetical protein